MDLLSTVGPRLKKIEKEYTLTWYNAAGVFVTVVQSRSVFNLLTAKLFNGIFTPLKLCLADAIHNFKLLKIIQIRQNVGQRFYEILLFDVTFYP